MYARIGSRLTPRLLWTVLLSLTMIFLITTVTKSVPDELSVQKVISWGQSQTDTDNIQSPPAETPAQSEEEHQHDVDDELNKVAEENPYDKPGNHSPPAKENPEHHELPEKEEPAHPAKNPHATATPEQTHDNEPNAKEPEHGKFAIGTVEGSKYDVEVPTDKDVNRYIMGADYLPPVDALKDIVPPSFDLGTAKAPSYTLFMFRTNASSTYRDIYALQKDAMQVCDLHCSMSGCDVNLPKDYDWESLSHKLVDTVKMFCASDAKTDVYVKLDDDVVMSPGELEDALKMFAASNCSYSSVIARDFSFYWGEGKIYMFKKEMLERACAAIPSFVVSHASEDVTMGMLINSTNPDEFCSLDGAAHFWHKKYVDQRMLIQFHTSRARFGDNGVEVQEIPDMDDGLDDALAGSSKQLEGEQLGEDSGVQPAEEAAQIEPAPADPVV